MAAIDAFASPSPWSAGQFHAACESDTGGPDSAEFALVAELGDGVAGFLVCQRVLDEVSIHNVAVSPAARRRGLARAMIREALRAQPEGVCRCLLEVRASNLAALALYRGLGFVEDGRRRDYYPAPEGREDAIMMSLKLQGTCDERA